MLLGRGADRHKNTKGCGFFHSLLCLLLYLPEINEGQIW